MSWRVFPLSPPGIQKQMATLGWPFVFVSWRREARRLRALRGRQGGRFEASRVLARGRPAERGRIPACAAVNDIEVGHPWVAICFCRSGAPKATRIVQKGSVSASLVRSVMIAARDDNQLLITYFVDKTVCFINPS